MREHRIFFTLQMFHGTAIDEELIGEFSAKERRSEGGMTKNSSFVRERGDSDVTFGGWICVASYNRRVERASFPLARREEKVILMGLLLTGE